MEKYTKRFSVEEVQEILNKHMGVKDTRIHCLTSHNGINWDGIQVSVYDENVTKTDLFDEGEQCETDELYNADPECDHRVVCAPGGVIKCVKCTGWVCD